MVYSSPITSRPDATRLATSLRQWRWAWVPVTFEREDAGKRMSSVAVDAAQVADRRTEAVAGPPPGASQ